MYAPKKKSIPRSEATTPQQHAVRVNVRIKKKKQTDRETDEHQTDDVSLKRGES